LVALIVAGAGKVGGHPGTAAGLAASAGLIFFFRESIGAESSLYSVPVRFWPPVLLVLSVLAAFGK
jgi:hypothetical protein